MAPRKHLRGPTNDRASRGLRAFRTARNLSVRDLAEVLEDLGHPLQPSGITRVEQGDRRVDIDDLVALAVALDVSPNALMMGGTEDLADDDTVNLTEERVVSVRQAWRWLNGQEVLPPWNTQQAHDDERRRRFPVEADPLLEVDDRDAYSISFEQMQEETRQLAEILSRIDDLAAESGLPPRAVLWRVGLEIQRREAEGRMDDAIAQARSDLDDFLEGEKAKREEERRKKRRDR